MATRAGNLIKVTNDNLIGVYHLDSGRVAIHMEDVIFRFKNVMEMDKFVHTLRNLLADLEIIGLTENKDGNEKDN
jgi:hypothetical protein